MAVKLTQEMKDVIGSQQCFIATCDKNNRPNVAPKRSTRVLDDQTLIFNEGTGKRTYANILDNSVVSIGVVDREKLIGFRFVGNAQLLESGDLYDQAAKMSEQAGMPKPKAVVTVSIEEIYDLKPGPTAGTRIG
ncbi:MAG: pyridoxamine 5'-phosphate oxidase family protein [Bacillota bacterium]|nr:pyridoxamine 5'-phosphate oxidase family protein [Bacillota bacterium]